jgi:hypothetical protein
VLANGGTPEAMVDVAASLNTVRDVVGAHADPKLSPLLPRF